MSKQKTVKNHENIYIHIKKSTLKKVFFFILKVAIIYLIIQGCIFGYGKIYNVGYEKGYGKGFIDGENFESTRVINQIRDYGQVYVCNNSGDVSYYDYDYECEMAYDFQDPCQEKPDYCSWDNTIEFNFTTLNFSDFGWGYLE